MIEAEGPELSVDTPLIAKIIVLFYSVQFGLCYTGSTIEVTKLADKEAAKRRRGVNC